MPDARPAADCLWESKVVDEASMYFVAATEFLEDEPITTVPELVEFCIGLVRAIQLLHEKAGLPHCGLKPCNLRWCAGIVRLIDFGSAHPIEDGSAQPGTEGFEAPEIMDGQPNSRSSDVFAVGATMLS